MSWVAIASTNFAWLHACQIMTTTKPVVSPTFAARKAAILASLSTPEGTYSDLSPKGSVDEAIIPLIRRINEVEGVVTTSSCAGRVSVFCEGDKHKAEPEELKGDAREQSDTDPRGQQISVPGGKGRGGRWLFVSHEPVETGSLNSRGSLLNLLGLPNASLDTSSTTEPPDCANMRLVRFQFEPMVSHSEGQIPRNPCAFSFHQPALMINLSRSSMSCARLFTTQPAS